MCGIFGVFDGETTRDNRNFATIMSQMLGHRGPDDQGYVQADGLMIGNTRLSIIDIEAGHQPMSSDDGRISVVQNGEIYNYVELAKEVDCRTHSDTEVILRLYEKYGDNFVHRLNGMFSIAILDRRLRQILLFRDRVGKKPLYYYVHENQILFASEVKALLACSIPRKLNWRALDSLLTFNYVPPPDTLFAGVQQILPGSRAVLDHRGIQQESWWKLASKPLRNRSLRQWEDEFLDTLEEAVLIRRRSDVPVGAFLSGGIDSSTVVKILSMHASEPIRSFCIGFADPRFDESKYANQVAKLCNTKHICQIVDPNMISMWPKVLFHTDQVHGDVSFMPMLKVSELASEYVKVVLTGDGGDELFAGYDVYQNYFNDKMFDAPQELFERKFYQDTAPFSEFSKSLLYSNRAKHAIGDHDPLRSVSSLFHRFSHLDRINQLLAVETSLLLPGNNLVKPDRMAMAESLEPRAPFLDMHMLDLAFQIPGELKLKQDATKWIYKRAVEKILPREIIYRKKQMFTVPVGEWFRNQLYSFAQSALLSSRAKDRDLFDANVIATMLQQHRNGQANHTRAIRLLIAIEIWHRCFFDRQHLSAPTLTELDLPDSNASIATNLPDFAVA